LNSWRTARSLTAAICISLVIGCGGGSGGNAGPIAGPPPAPPPPPPPPPAVIALSSRVLNFSASITDLAVSSTRGEIYASLGFHNELLILEAGSYLTRDRFHVGPQPGVMALSADESRLYVALTYGGGVAIVDLNSHAVQRVDVATAIGAHYITALLEVRPGLLLIGTTATRIPSRLVTLDLNQGNAINVVAGGTEVLASTAMLMSPDEAFVYVVDTQASNPPGYVLKLDATQPGLPLVLRASIPTTNRYWAINQDGTRLISGGGLVFDTGTMDRIVNGFVDGTVAKAINSSAIVRGPGARDLYSLDPVTLAVTKTYSTDCPPGLVTDITSSEASGEWMILDAGMICVVSTTAPTVAPGAAADRRLPDRAPPQESVASVEIAMIGGTDIVLDEDRGVAYVAIPMQQRVAVVSLAQFSVIDSIPAPGEIRYIVMSEDGQTLYGGLFDQGRVISIDLDSRDVVGNVDLLSLLGGPGVASIVEIGPGELIVGVHLQSADPSYIVHVLLDDPGNAQRIGCSDGYGSTALWQDPDHDYLYIATNTTRCPVLEKRDVSQPGFPLVITSQPNMSANLGGGQISADGAHLLGASGEIISTNSLWTIGLIVGGRPIASSNPDIVYAAGLYAVSTSRIHDFAWLSIALHGCVSTGDPFGVLDAVVTRDESRFYLLGGGGGLCAVEALPIPANPPGWPD
jgi:DNA-binding beta-propeller fold protein YncE